MKKNNKKTPLINFKKKRSRNKSKRKNKNKFLKTVMSTRSKNCSQLITFHLIKQKLNFKLVVKTMKKRIKRRRFTKNVKLSF